MNRAGLHDVAGLLQRPEVAWHAPTDHPVLAAPVLTEGNVIVVDTKSVVYAFDAESGALRWRHDHAEWRRNQLDEDWEEDVDFPTAAAVWGSWVFVFAGFVCEGGPVFVHDLATGDVVQTIEDGGCPTVVGDVLLMHDLYSTYGVRAVRLPDLEALWSREWFGWLMTSPAISSDGTGYAALGWEGHRTHGGLTAFEVATGAEVFARGDQHEPCPVDGDGEDWVVLAPSDAVVAEDLVWMTVVRSHEDDGVHDEPWAGFEIVGLDPRSGDQRWVYRLDPSMWSLGDKSLAVADGAVYVEALQGREHGDDTGEPQLLAVDIASAAARWIKSLRSAGIGPPVLARGVLYHTAVSGEITGFDALTGETRWTLDLGKTIARNTPDDDEIYAEDSLAVLPADGVLYVRVESGLVALR